MYSYKTYLAYLFGSLAFSIGVQMLLPYPYGLIVAIGSFVVFPLLARRIMIKTGRLGYPERAKMTKTCTVCHCNTKGDTCKRCGSRQFKMG